MPKRKDRDNSRDLYDEAAADAGLIADDATPYLKERIRDDERAREQQEEE